MKVGVIGLGNLGTATAQLAAVNGCDVLGWEYDRAVVDEVNSVHRNQRYLAGTVLSKRFRATANVADVFQFAELVFIALPSRFLLSVLTDVAGGIDQSIAIVNMAKGIDASTGKTAFATVAALFPHNPVAMLAGPSLANEFNAGVLTGVVAASVELGLSEKISSVLSNSRFVVTRSDDPLGVELGAILKNIYALGMGLFHSGKDFGLNFVGAYLTQALSEIMALATAMGAQRETLLQLSGIGDLIATAMSEHSHNRAMGELVGQGLGIAAIEQQLGVLPEGYNTLAVALRLAQQYGVDLPLAQLLSCAIRDELPIAEVYDRFAVVLKGN